jgi:hypothetical protein
LLVGGLEHFYDFPETVGNVMIQLTFRFFRGVAQPPSSLDLTKKTRNIQDSSTARLPLPAPWHLPAAGCAGCTGAGRPWSASAGTRDAWTKSAGFFFQVFSWEKWQFGKASK